MEDPQVTRPSPVTADQPGVAEAPVDHRPRPGPLERRTSLRRLSARAGNRVLTALDALRQLLLTAAAGLILCSVVPVFFGWITTVVVSGSMEPAIHTGDIVVASPVDPAMVGRLAPGTVVLVEDPAVPGRTLLHRLVKYTPDGRLIIRGDANAVADSTPVPVANVRGMARLRIPGLGLPVIWVQHGQYAAVVALAVLALITVFWRPRRAFRPGRR